jgi:hypothetical protein
MIDTPRIRSGIQGFRWGKLTGRRPPMNPGSVTTHETNRRPPTHRTHSPRSGEIAELLSTAHRATHQATGARPGLGHNRLEPLLQHRIRRTHRIAEHLVTPSPE